MYALEGKRLVFSLLTVSTLGTEFIGIAQRLRLSCQEKIQASQDGYECDHSGTDGVDIAFYPNTVDACALPYINCLPIYLT